MHAPLIIPAERLHDQDAQGEMEEAEAIKTKKEGRR